MNISPSPEMLGKPVMRRCPPLRQLVGDLAFASQHYSHSALFVVGQSVMV